MSILFVASSAAEVGGNTTAFNSGNLPSTNYTAPFDPDYSTECIGAQLDQTDPSGVFSITTPAPSGDYWMRFRTQWSNVSGVSNLDGNWLNIYDANGDRLGYLDFYNGGVRVFVNGDSNAWGPYGFTPSAYAVHFFDLKVSVGADITIEFYVDGALASSATAANTDGKGPPVQVLFDHDDMYYTSASPVSWLMYSEFIVTDGEPTIGMRLASLDIDAAGAHSGLSGSVSDLLDANDGAAMVGDADGEKSSWTLTAYNGPATPASVRAVCTKLTASKGITGPQNLQHLLRIGTTDYNSPNRSPRPEGDLYVWDNNPATAAAWDTADFTGMEQGVEVKA